ncbi:hypothetical protein GGTG_08023 [Gaeumannomyces tritici R3-111a-1]|uniref:AB hydrolase-1 domain-containing protein n=1 Tax=Gaeumannomyces tritici (strain R3-111a-1) TaxID=644352 RepID=J3P3D6_GAET3|nr:hypothetical protein GGTG_08023 [Gaeumannomyces tritici R3-111a-1]EJT74178.1 hypothetical protein GGTG_08023 [Gaeumannomyces tritici R3-111a-1]
MKATPTIYTNNNVGLFELPPPSPDWEKTHGTPELDVVAVHGLNGECFRTWTHEEPTGEKTLWLSDLLPHKLPRTRVMTFGYNASVVGNTSVAGVRDNARYLLNSLRDKREYDGTHDRPIVFVGHSLGGIVIKQALRMARNEPRLVAVADNTKGIVFFGTPHRGTDAASWGELAAKLKSASYGTRPRSPFFKLLRSNSNDLMNLSEDFRPIAQNYALVSFVEQNIISKLGFNRVVVAKHSAVMEMPHEEQAFINGDHSTMCKFSRDPADAVRFNSVWRSIERAAKGTDARPAPSLYDLYQKFAHGTASGETATPAKPGAGRIEGSHADQARPAWSAAPVPEGVRVGGGGGKVHVYVG